MRYADVAETMTARIASGVYHEGEVLPSETALATEFGVARGTIRRALEELESRRGLASRRGRRWVAHRASRRQSLDVLRSFGQWALSAGAAPAGETVDLTRGFASAGEAVELRLRRRDPVLRIVRVMSLDGHPAMVKRTTYPEWLSTIIEDIPRDARSIMEIVEGIHGVALGHAENRISAVAAGTDDAQLLRLPRGTPLLRVQRTARAADGRAFEASDDRYSSHAVTLSLLNESR